VRRWSLRGYDVAVDQPGTMLIMAITDRELTGRRNVDCREGKRAMGGVEKVGRAAAGLAGGLALLPAVGLALVVLACGGRDQGSPQEAGAQDDSLVKERFEAYIQAHNSHDIEAELALYADEVVFEVPQNTAILAREDLRPRLEWEAVTESHLSVSGIEIDDGTVTINDLVETSKWLQLAGIEAMVYEPGTQLVFADGLISEVLPAPPTEASQDAVELAMNELMDWVMENRPEALEGMPGGQLPYDGEGARKLLELLAAWREATQ
jgi:hypothetical protein